jgi:lipoyl(octanoyl) transferase
MTQTLSSRRIHCRDLGLISYSEAWDYQKQLHQYLINRKRNVDQDLEQGVDFNDHFFLICSHPPVYTLGKSGKMDHLLKSENDLMEEGFEFFKINRGGDITYHGPGQIVGYPILDLDAFFTDVHKYVRFLEEAIIRTLAEWNIVGYREPDYTGVWVMHDELPAKRKICAIGVHLSRWVTMHGFAFNVQTDLSHFNNIVPCGISSAERDVCSMESILGNAPDMDLVKQRLIHHFSEIFETEILQESTIYRL